MRKSDFSRMFNPRGIAIVGASTEPTRPGAQTLFALKRLGYRGGIFPVNPRYPEIQETKCFASVDDISEACDVAVIALPAAQVAPVIEQCGRKGIGFAVVLGGGFREDGPQGVLLERNLLETARAGGVRIIGPNCLGFVNVQNRAYAGFGSITRPPDLKPGPVSAVIQSGGFGNSLIVQAALAGVGFQNLVASGNETDIKATELIRAFVDDPQTRIILAYLEGVSDGRAFMSAARYALAAGKPLVVLKAGNTEQGLLAAASHTACMTCSYDIYRAAFKQCGVIEAHDIEDTVDYLQCLATGRPGRGRSVAVMGGSGGASVNFSDAADHCDLALTPFGHATLAVLKDNLPSMGSTQNPIDYTANFVTEANTARLVKAMDAVLADPAIDQLGVLAATASGASFRIIAQSVAQALKKSDKPVMIFSSSQREMSIEALEILAAENVPVLRSPRRVAAAMGVLADYAASLQQRERLIAEYPVSERTLPKLPLGAVTMDEHAAKQLLSGFGVSVTHDTLLPVGIAAASLPRGMAFPVAMKIVSKDIAHKTDIGAVRLNIADDAQLAGAVTEVIANARKAAPGAQLSGVLVSEMVSDGMETIIGVVNDPLFGPVVAFGLGGIFAEVLHDTTYRIAPFGIDTAREMISELRAAALFSGVRGQPQRDIDALAKTLSTVSELAWLMRDRIAEMDINPVLVRPAGQGAIAADALIVLK